MTGIIEIKDDPRHPEGGHAVILFRDAVLDGSFATLTVESLTDGFDYRGPRRLDVSTRSADRGFEVGVGPDVVGALKQGLAVNLTLAGTGIGSDVLWPVLTPPRAVRKRNVIQSGPARRVVDDSGIATPPGTSAAGATASGNGGSSFVQTNKGDPPDITIVPLIDGDTPGATSQATETDSLDSVTANDGPEAAIVARSKPQGWRLPAVAAVAALAFAGGGTMTGLWFIISPPTPRIVTADAELALPSPYAMLNSLADRSPDGTTVNVGDGSSFRRRSKIASSAEDVSFWRKSAMRALLASKTNDAAAILNDFAIDLAETHGTKQDLAAARFVWEMASIGQDCAAMGNIAKALVAGDKSDSPEEAAIWRKRADTCRNQSPPER